MKTFLKPKPEKTKKTKRDRHLKAKISFAILFCLIFIAFGYLLTYLIVEYKETHTFTLQTPLVIERNLEIVNPTATTSALPIVYAAEVENPFPVESPKGLAWEAVKEKWGLQEWGYLEELVFKESGWNPYSINRSSGAAGLFQSLGHSDYTCEGWEFECQIDWGLNYIENRYNTPREAMAFWNNNNWY